MFPKKSSLFFSAALAVASFPQLSSAAVLNTITTTGYTHDVFYEAGLAAGDSFNGTGKGITRSFGDRTFHEKGAYSSAPTSGHNVVNTGLTSATGNTVNFNFQSFTANNALFVTSNTTVSTLAFTGSQAYSTLGIVTSASNLGQTNLAVFSYTIRYAGGLTQTGTFSVDDWGATAGGSTAATSLEGTAKALFSGTRSETKPVNPSAPVDSPDSKPGKPTPSTLFGDTQNGAGSFRFYLAEITPIYGAAIEGIDFTASRSDSPTTSLSDAAIFGVVGTVIPEPSSSLLVAGAFGMAALIRRRK